MEESALQYVLGEPLAKRTWSTAVVLQGPWVPLHTERAIRVFLERNTPDVLVIVATYHPPGCRTADDFLSDYEKNIVLRHQGPHVGRLVYLFINEPSRETYPDFWRTNYWNQNLQRLSSFIGLRYAKNLGIPRALKCRADAFLGMSNVCGYLRTCLEELPVFPDKDFDSRRLLGRIVVSDYAVRQCDNVRSPSLGPHQIADLWFFGYTDDLMLYFDIREQSTWAGGAGISTACAVENNLTEQWMRDVGITTQDGAGELTARYMYICDRVEVEYVSPKAEHDYERYIREGKPYLAQVFAGETCKRLTHSLWRTLLKDYEPKLTPPEASLEITSEPNS